MKNEKLNFVVCLLSLISSITVQVEIELRTIRRFPRKGGWHPQPIHGQPDVVLSELHLTSLFFLQAFLRY
jgi:hypothetical protein